MHGIAEPSKKERQSNAANSLDFTRAERPSNTSGNCSTLFDQEGFKLLPVCLLRIDGHGVATIILPKSVTSRLQGDHPAGPDWVQLFLDREGFKTLACLPLPSAGHGIAARAGTIQHDLAGKDSTFAGLLK